MKTHLVRIHKTCNAQRRQATRAAPRLRRGNAEHPPRIGAQAGAPAKPRSGFVGNAQVTRSSSLSLRSPGTIVIGTVSFAA